jgi:hypothetical protein
VDCSACQCLTATLIVSKLGGKPWPRREPTVSRTTRASCRNCCIPPDTFGKSGVVGCMISKPYRSVAFALQSRMICTYGTLLVIQSVSLFLEIRTCSSALSHCGSMCVLCHSSFVSRMCYTHVLSLFSFVCFEYVL